MFFCCALRIDVVSQEICWFLASLARIPLREKGKNGHCAKCLFLAHDSPGPTEIEITLVISVCLGNCITSCVGIDFALVSCKLCLHGFLLPFILFLCVPHVWSETQL